MGYSKSSTGAFAVLLCLAVKFCVVFAIRHYFYQAKNFKLLKYFSIPTSQKIFSAFVEQNILNCAYSTIRLVKAPAEVSL